MCSYPKTRRRIHSCRLDDPDLGIVSENDHQVGRCLCKFCTCGRHSCAGQRQTRYADSTFWTSYGKDFRPGQFDFPLKPDRSEEEKDSRTIPMITTNKADYQAFKVTPVKDKTLYWSSSPGRSSELTSYKNSFCQWETPKVKYEKRFHPPVRSTEIPFTCSSSYQTCYKSPTTQGNQSNIWLNDLKSLSKSTEFTFGPENDKVSTYKSQMQDFSKNLLNPKITHAGETKAIFAKTTQKHESTSKCDFTKRKNPTKDPRQMKFLLQAS